MNAITAMLPPYRSHKIVRAGEIERVDYDEDGAWVHFRDKGIASLRSDLAPFIRYKPEPGDYFVVYEDGYQSVSPRQVFRDGYRPLDAGQKPFFAPVDCDPKTPPLTKAIWATIGAVITLAVQIVIVVVTAWGVTHGG